MNLEETAALSIPPAEPRRVMIWSASLSPDEALKRAWTILSVGFDGEMSWNKNRDQSYESARMRGCQWWVDLEKETVTHLETEKIMALSQWIREEYTC